MEEAEAESVSRRQRKMSGTRTWSEEGVFAEISAEELVDIEAGSSSHLKISGAATGEGEGVFSRRHRKISGARTGDEEVVSAGDAEVEVVWRGV